MFGKLRVLSMRCFVMHCCVMCSLVFVYDWYFLGAWWCGDGITFWQFL